MSCVWSQAHGLKINAKKTQAVIIAPNNVIDLNVIQKILVMGENVAYSKKVKNLGLIIDDVLSWSPQVSSVCQKVNLCLHNLYKFQSVTPFETRHRLVNSLVMPHFDYCDIVYGDLNADCLSRLQKAQNRAVRYIFNVKHREHITPFYMKLSMLKIKERHDLHTLIMTYKILKNYAPSYFPAAEMAMNIRPLFF